MKHMIEQLKKYRIGVLAGGPSSEREISLKSGKAVFDSLSGLGLDVVFLDVTEKDFSDTILSQGIGLAFIALHGHFGEDGTVQRLLEEKGIPYTGSGPASSLMALDKIATKERFKEKGVRTPQYRIFREGSEPDQEKIWSPCVIKPRYEGSSIGLTIVFDPAKVKRAFDLALEYSDEVMVEEFIDGRELTVGVLEGEPLPVVEIMTARGIYDYDAKYVSDSTRYVAPAEIDPVLRRSLQLAGIKAHEALGCSGFSRVDIRLSDKGEAYVLEVNTIPGLTERSLLPMAAEAAGISFSELCVRILMSGLKKK